jgi:hypothetical protein
MTLSIAQVICPKSDSKLRSGGGGRSNICPLPEFGEGEEEEGSKIYYTLLAAYLFLSSAVLLRTLASFKTDDHGSLSFAACLFTFRSRKSFCTTSSHLILCPYKIFFVFSLNFQLTSIVGLLGTPFYGLRLNPQPGNEPTLRVI